MSRPRSGSWKTAGSSWKTAARTLWVVALVFCSRIAQACPVCFGETDSPIVQGIEASVLFMVGVTYCLILGGAALFIVLRRRARRMEREQAGVA